MKFGFTSWTNDNNSPYADFIHMRSYTDSSGGADNLIMFKKSGIGMRIWQQTWGSTSPYSSYVDAWTTGNFTQTDVNNWNTAYGWGNHATAGYLTSVTNISGYAGTLISEDNRTISPSEDDASKLRFGFTSYANNDTSSFADYLHLRSYADSSGGNDNLVMFNKSFIGMRIWQQTFGSATAYATYKDVAFTDQAFYIGTTSVAINRASASQTLTGVSIDGNAGTATILQTARTIGGVSFNGSAAINLPGVNTAGNQNTTGSSASCTGNAATATNSTQLGGAAASSYIRNDTDGTAGNIFSLITVTKSLTLTTSWLDTGISGTSDLANSGAYIITMNADNYAVGGGQYNETYTGIMYWYAGGTNDAGFDEIVLHKSGHAPNAVYINLRTLRNASGVLKLQIISSAATNAASNYIFKFRTR